MTSTLNSSNHHPIPSTFTTTIPFPLPSPPPSHSHYPPHHHPFPLPPHHHPIPSILTSLPLYPPHHHPFLITITFPLPSPSHSLYPHHPIPSTLTSPLPSPSLYPPHHHPITQPVHHTHQHLNISKRGHLPNLNEHLDGCLIGLELYVNCQRPLQDKIFYNKNTVLIFGVHTFASHLPPPPPPPPPPPNDRHHGSIAYTQSYAYIKGPSVCGLLEAPAS